MRTEAILPTPPPTLSNNNPSFVPRRQRVSSRRFTSPRGKKLTGLARKYPLDRASAGPPAPARIAAQCGHILLAATTPETAAATTAMLARAGYRLATVLGIDEALHVMARERFDLVVIGGDDGQDSTTRRLRRIRGHEVVARRATDPAAVGILVLMDRSTPGVDARRRAALAEGADDVLVEPFPAAELLVRVATLLRRIARAPADPRETLTLANLHIDVAAHQVLVGDRLVDLTPAEFTLLRTLAERKGRLCTRASLATTDRGRASARGVDMRISRVRRKIDGAGLVIECIRGEGYRLSPARAAAS